ncbi:branched-chain alpha-keto acid dehydrogenase subunit E2 [Marinomonas agarivorans]|nr:branched-chain alpha-keto acid dehydrogenase subunit E2 [Marinomonas agarivorans]
MKDVLVWDWPVRLFHWLTALLFSGLVLSGKLDGNYLQHHICMGYALSGVLLARILYGILGSKYARFVNFPLHPKHIFNYFLSIVTNKKPQYLGHNPLGSIMVIALLGLLTVQTVSGLANSDEVFWFGPLYEWVDSEWQERLAAWHSLLPDVLLILVMLHIAAVFWYEIRFNEALSKAMVVGRKKRPSSSAEPVSEGQEPPKNEDDIISATTPKLGLVISLTTALCWLLWLCSTVI